MYEIEQKSVVVSTRDFCMIADEIRRDKGPFVLGRGGGCFLDISTDKVQTFISSCMMTLNRKLLRLYTSSFSMRRDFPV